ncbi:MAG: hypothetical protein ABIH63_01820 [archaeon]
MIPDERLEGITNYIFRQLKLVSPANPSFIKTSYGVDVALGNLKIRVFNISKRDGDRMYFNEVAKARDFGTNLEKNEHYVRQGAFKSSRMIIAWYLTAKNEILP